MGKYKYKMRVFKNPKSVILSKAKNPSPNQHPPGFPPEFTPYADTGRE